MRAESSVHNLTLLTAPTADAARLLSESIQESDGARKRSTLRKTPPRAPAAYYMHRCIAWEIGSVYRTSLRSARLRKVAGPSTKAPKNSTFRHRLFYAVQHFEEQARYWMGLRSFSCKTKRTCDPKMKDCQLLCDRRIFSRKHVCRAGARFPELQRSL